MDNRVIDDIARRIGDLLPAGARQLQQDIEKNVRAIVRSNLERLDLVTREEFDVQSAVLAETRARLKALERRIAALEGTPLPEEPGPKDWPA